MKVAKKAKAAAGEPMYNHKLLDQAFKANKDMNATVLAAMAGVSVETVHSVLKGRRNVTVSTLRRIAEILEVDLTQVFAA